MNVYMGLTQATRSELPEMNMANSLLNRGNYQDASTLYDRIFQVTREPEALYGLALCKFHAAEPQTALQVIERVLERDHDNARAYNLAGVIAISIGDLEGGESLFSTALALAPDLLDARRNLGELYLHRGEISRGLDWMQALLREYPEDSATLLRLAELCVEARRFNDASRYLDQVRLSAHDQPRLARILDQMRSDSGA